MTEIQDVYHVHSPVLERFVSEVKQIVNREPDRAITVKALRPIFDAMLKDKTWLPQHFQSPDPEGGMGEGVGNYLIYRSAERDLSLMSLVLPPGASTPVHDHLAWGLVGLYAGEQDEWVYRREDDGAEEGRADLIETEKRRLNAHDFYELLPPDGDIHRVRATGSAPSVSLHLLGNDIGCTWRHRYRPEEHLVQPFRSSYSNDPCHEELG